MVPPRSALFEMPGRPACVLPLSLTILAGPLFFAPRTPSRQGLDLSDNRARRIMIELQKEARVSRDRSREWAKNGHPDDNPDGIDDFVARVIDKVYKVRTSRPCPCPCPPRVVSCRVMSAAPSH